MANYHLNAEVRSGTGKAVAKKLRRNNLVPGSVYGRGKANHVISIKLGDMDRAIQSGANLIDLSFGDSIKTVIIKEVQMEPVRGLVQHVDFYEVSMDRAIDTTVAIILSGEEDREADGGVLNQVLRELSISCLPGDIPDALTVDVSKLVVGDSIQVSDLVLPEEVTVLTELDDVVATVTVPEAIVEETDEDADADVDGEETEATEEDTETEE